ncbi:hypothetical protein B0I35DRAFT_442785 [Stachybotrys elegans]|uniref:Uncharacterized protein n=1 Tax=Stachybotrys elegans TaxID=80388 RepID=A0A8K0SK67_9HYPO|nr:hypothetical protein B0I35DRAFT_442785 [Stachybotrys elegans]
MHNCVSAPSSEEQCRDWLKYTWRDGWLTYTRPHVSESSSGRVGRYVEGDEKNHQP